VSRFNTAQRIVATIAWGLALLLVGGYVTSASPFSGWTGYAPLSARAVYSALGPSRFGLNALGDLFVWLGIVVVWLGGALLLLRGRKETVG
jgi:hypothetical protein